MARGLFDVLQRRKPEHKLVQYVTVAKYEDSDGDGYLWERRWYPGGEHGEEMANALILMSIFADDWEKEED